MTGKLIAPELLFPPGTVFEEKYRIGGALGVGGMGAVFEATHVLLGSRVAIKLLLPEHAEDQEMCGRLMREARIASSTGHRSITRVLDIGHTREGAVYLVMELVTGRSLERVILDEPPISSPRAAVLISHVLAGLEVVHRKGIVHRDLKPSNLMVTVDEEGIELVKILDFGISKVAGEVSPLTTIGKVMGTPWYMAPEQARGESDLDARTDIYACGAILYHMLTGRPPLDAPNLAAMISTILEGVIQEPSRIARGISPAMDEIVLRALARRRDQRFPDATAFRRALRPFCAAFSAKTALGHGPSTLPELGRAATPPGPSEGDEGLAPPGPPEGDEGLAPPGALLRAGSEEGPLGREANPLGAPWAALADSPAKIGPAETRLAETRLAETRLAETRPAETRPAEMRPAETRPATTSTRDREDRAAHGSMSSGVLGGAQRQGAELDEEVAGLELAEEVLDARRAAGGTLYQGGSRRNARRLVSLAVAVLLVSLALLAAWHQRQWLRGLFFGSDSTRSEKVLLLVETEPRGAEVLVDGVLATSNPVALPRSERTFLVRVQARGFQSRTVEVRADRSQTLRVKLKPWRMRK
jgi:hypothetical protein